VRDVHVDQTVHQGEPVQAADRDDRAGGRGCRQWRMVGVAGAQVGEERADPAGVDIGEGGHAGTVQEVDVPVEIAAVGRQGVGRRAALDGEVVEVGTHHPRRFEAAGQPRAGGHRPGLASHAASAGRSPA
jgi:hypothetical protein